MALRQRAPLHLCSRPLHDPTLRLTTCLGWLCHMNLGCRAAWQLSCRSQSCNCTMCKISTWMSRDECSHIARRHKLQLCIGELVTRAGAFDRIDQCKTVLTWNR